MGAVFVARLPAQGMAVGMLAKVRIADHKTAKRVARRILMQTMDQFRETFTTVDCRDLIGLDLRLEDQHQQFVESGVWRTTCMGQVEFVVRQLVALGDEDIWGQVLSQMEASMR